MHPTSSLIAGGVLLFGAAGLANLYLPAPQGIPVHASAPLFTHNTSGPHLDPKSTIAASSPVPEPSVLAQPLPTIAPIPAAVAPSVTSSPPAASTAQVPAAVTAPTRRASVPLEHKLRVVAAHSEHHPILAHRPSEQPASRHSLLVKRTPVAAAIARSPLHGRRPASATDHPSRPQQFSLSATLGERAWIRIGDHRTVMAVPGNVIPELGRVVAVGPNSVTFSDGRILSTKP